MDKIASANTATSLYEDLLRMNALAGSPFNLKKNFKELSISEKSVWEQYISRFDEKLQSVGLSVRPYEEFCKTCIITEREIETLLASDHARFSLAADNGHVQLGLLSADQEILEKTETERRFFMELNYLMPLQIKRNGFEIVRAKEDAEIDIKMVRRLARAIHSRYLKNAKLADSISGKTDSMQMFIVKETGSRNLNDFDDLPEEIRNSNIDSAYHIPAKLLSVGYKIKALGKGYKSRTLRMNEAEIEIMARVEHLRWSWDKRLNGWVFGNVKDNVNKTHPGLIPYDELSEAEKEKDRELVRMIPALLQDIGYEAYPVNPESLENITYEIKPQSIIYRILHETREMSDQIRSLAVLTPALEESLRIRNSRIEGIIAEIRESYNYAYHMQKTFLPDELYVRECFPDSFVLFKPKDIVSGDFYFFSRRGDVTVFAAADCTGHGIPGALISTIGYGILDQAVNEINLTDPSDILYHLYSRVHRFLRHDPETSGVHDDMDIALCMLDAKTNILTYSGVKNPLYISADGELIRFNAQNLPEGCGENGDCSFISDQITLRPGDTIYLGSDGFADQFGGKNHKKYQSSRFREFLMSIRNYSMPEQSDLLYEENERWREESNEEQTDDILIIGIRV